MIGIIQRSGVECNAAKLANVVEPRYSRKPVAMRRGMRHALVVTGIALQNVAIDGWRL